MATGRAIVEKSLDELKSSLAPGDARVFSDTRLEHVWQAARKIEREQGARMELRFMRRVEPFLRSLESYAPTIEVFCQGFSPMAFVWGPIKLMLQLARQYSEIMEKLLQAFNDLAGYLPRLDRLKATFGNESDFEHALGLVYSDVAEFFRRVYKFFRRKAWHILFAFDWGLFERRFKSILEKLRTHCDLLDREAATIHFSEMKAMREKRELEEEEFEKHRRIQFATEVFAWLSADRDSQEEYLHRISDNRQPGTCNWILEDQQIRSWIEDDNSEPVIWITGIPGSGKSYLCSLITQNLETHKDLSSTYYFCSHHRSDRETSATILKTLIAQILQCHLDMAGFVHQAYLQKGSSRSFPAMKRMLREVVSSIPNVRIILDGLDECDHSTQREVLGSLLEVQKHTGDHCKLLLFSREEPLIGRTMPSRIRIKLDGRTTDGLNLFIQNKVNELKSYFPRIEPALLKLIGDRLQRKAKGMFLWVRLVCTMLQQQMTNAELERAAEELPDGLEEAYGLILSRFRQLGPSLRYRVFRILFWVSVAYRPVSIHEVADGVTLYPGQVVLSKKTRCQDLHRDIVEVCAPLLEKARDGVLDLVHFSAKEYLVHQQSGPFIDIAQAHFSVAFSCIVNLTSALVILRRFGNGASAADIENNILQGSYGLQPYGHHFWAEHVLAYTEHAREPYPQLTTLIDALEAFSKVRKTRPPIYPEPITGSSQTHDLKCLEKFRQHPHLHDFISGWIRFKSKMQSTEAPVGDLQAQKDCHLLADETYLSLVDYNLREIAERLVSLKATGLPLHIDQSDYQTFIDRFSFACRFLHCTQQFNSTGDRDAHEQTHAINFPCLQCDFSDRGFKSRKDLQRHTKMYHTSAEDLEIPLSLYGVTTRSPEIFDRSPGRYSASIRNSTCWNEQGRKVIQKGFQQVLTKLESGQDLVGRSAELLSSADPNESEKVVLEPSLCLEEESPAALLNSIREKVEGQQYETLTDFKADVWALSRRQDAVADSEKIEQIQAFCDKEFEKAISEYSTFANFKSDSSKSRSNMPYPDSSFRPQQNILEPSMDLESKAVSSIKASLGKRKPYWSIKEEEEFPALLEKCGRDFIKIADHLKTKTIDEVDKHLVDLISSGRTDLLRIANAADARLQHESEPALSSEDERNVEPKELISAEPPKVPVPEAIIYSSETLEAMNFHRLHQKDPSFENGNTRPNEDIGSKTNSSMLREKSGTCERSKRTTRRPRPRVLCGSCNRNKDGLHDEYAFQKHYDRFHRATRQVWICDDISIDKKFLAKCKPCSTGKRYSAKHNASKHLRLSHFGDEASSEKLSRWMLKMEEPNPNFDKDGPEAPAANTTRPFETWQGNKRQKTEGPLHLLQNPNLSNQSNLLPPMQTRSNKPSSLSQWSCVSATPNPHQDLQEDETGSSKSSSEEEFDTIDEALVLPGISFDSFLPGASFALQPIGATESPHRTNLALIKPEQVDRLPHLDTFRKTVCQDQVEALYRILDEQQVGGERYQEALENLKLLSRTLLQNLMDWRRRSTLAPPMPFSV